VFASALGLLGIYDQNWLPIVLGAAGVVLNLVALRAFMRSGKMQIASKRVSDQSDKSGQIATSQTHKARYGWRRSLRRWVLWSLLAGVLVSAVFTAIIVAAADPNPSSSDLWRDFVATAIMVQFVALPLGFVMRYFERKNEKYPKEWDPKGMTARRSAVTNGATWFAAGFGLALFNEANLTWALLIGAVVGGSFAALAHHSFVRGSRIERDKP